MAGRQDYEERKQAKIDRLNDAAYKASKESEAQYKRSHDLVKNIPLGQPNIAGRTALPNLRKKSINAFEKAIELDGKSDYYAERANTAENNKAISSDDPEAVSKLKEKLTALESKREEVKAFNKAAKKNGTEKAPWYTLPYISADIKRINERIAKLEHIDSMPAETITFNGGEIISDAADNRIKIIFDEIQSDEIIAKLKSHGFHWSPSEKAWQRLRSPQSLYIAKKLMNL